jgi:hypothetical protein
MRKIFSILFLILVFSCRKVDIPVPDTSLPNTNIFSSKQSEVVDGQEIKFNLKYDGFYTLTIGDSITNQVITRERFAGKSGENKLSLYTKTLPKTSLYLLLEDQNRSEVGKTTIIIK